MHTNLKWTLAVLATVGLVAVSTIRAGTLLFKDGTSISGVKLISITDGRITVEKDKAKRSFPLNTMKSYFQADLPEGNRGDLANDLADYAVRIIEVKMPKRGKDKDGETTSCKINYSIARKGSGPVKFPYFYLYVICSRDSEAEERPIYRYCYPNEAKPKGKGYDQAAVMTKLGAFNRPTIGEDEQSDFKQETGNLSGREVTLSLKGIGNRNIIAYRLEIWGNEAIVANKEDKVDILESRQVDKRWWERY